MSYVNFLLVNTSSGKTNQENQQMKDWFKTGLMLKMNCHVSENYMEVDAVKIAL